MQWLDVVEMEVLPGEHTETVVKVSWEAFSHSTAWKLPKYGVFSGPYFPVIGLNTEFTP